MNCEFTYNNQVHTSTNYFLFYLNTGQEFIVSQTLLNGKIDTQLNANIEKYFIQQQTVLLNACDFLKFVQDM